MYMSTTFKDVFSKTARQIKAKSYVEPPLEIGKKVYINGPGHMPKMATTPIIDQKPSKKSFPTELIVI